MRQALQPSASDEASDPEMHAPASLGKLKLPSRVSTAAGTDNSNRGDGGVQRRVPSKLSTCPSWDAHSSVTPKPILVGSYEGDLACMLGQPGEAHASTRMDGAAGAVHQTGPIRPTLIGAHESDVAHVLARPRDGADMRSDALPQRKRTTTEEAPAAISSHALVDGATVMLWKGRRTSQPGRARS